MSNVEFGEFYALGHVLANGQLFRYSRGERGYTARFESQLADKIGVNQILAVDCGTNALSTALAATGHGCEYLVLANTQGATALVPLAVGAGPTSSYALPQESSMRRGRSRSEKSAPSVEFNRRLRSSEPLTGKEE